LKFFAKDRVTQKMLNPTTKTEARATPKTVNSRFLFGFLELSSTVISLKLLSNEVEAMEAMETEEALHL
jgi:hypothetical protein